MRHFFTAGQSLQEYALIFGLVTVLGVGVLMTLGDTLSDLLTGDRPVQGLQSTTDILVTSTPSGGGTTAPNVFFDSQSETLSFNLPNGQPVTLEQFPLDVQEGLNTTSIEGVNAKLLDTLDSLVQQLEGSNAFSPEMLYSLKNLSNKAHALGGVQGGLEQGANNMTSLHTPAAPIQAYLAQYYDEIMSIGYLSDETTSDYAVNLSTDPALEAYMKKLYPPSEEKGYQAVGTSLYDTLKAYQKAEESGALSNTEVKTVVDMLMKNIVDVSQAVHQSALTQPDQMATTAASHLTHDNAGGICVVAQGESTGHSCQ
jgi:hypothetical protein